MEFNFLKGQVVLITGASSGIGLACAEIAIKNEAKVILLSRTIYSKKEYFVSLCSNDENLLVLEVDVTNADAVSLAVEQGMKKFGRIDILIANAGISMRALFQNTDLNVLHRLMNVNFWGAVHCIKAVLPDMIKRNEGAIVTISSVAGFKGLPARTGYSASKFALIGFMDALRIELLKTNIHLSVIAPGYTNSNIRRTALNAKGEQQAETPLNEAKLMSADSVARSIYEAVSKKEAEKILSIEGKLSFLLKFFAPRFLDRIVFRKISKEINSPF